MGRLYSTSEVKRITGITNEKLKRLDDRGKVIPEYKTIGMRYYTEEQIDKIMEYMKVKTSYAFVYENIACVEDKITCDINLKEKKSEMRRILKNNGVHDADIMIEIEENHKAGIKEKRLVDLAVKGLVKKVYVSSDLGFNAEKLKKWIEMFEYFGIEVIDLQ